MGSTGVFGISPGVDLSSTMQEIGMHSPTVLNGVEGSSLSLVLLKLCRVCFFNEMECSILSMYRSYHSTLVIHRCS